MNPWIIAGALLLLLRRPDGAPRAKDDGPNDALPPKPGDVPFPEKVPAGETPGIGDLALPGGTAGAAAGAGGIGLGATVALGAGAYLAGGEVAERASAALGQTQGQQDASRAFGIAGTAAFLAGDKAYEAAKALGASEDQAQLARRYAVSSVVAPGIGPALQTLGEVGSKIIKGVAGAEAETKARQAVSQLDPSLSGSWAYSNITQPIATTMRTVTSGVLGFFGIH